MPASSVGPGRIAFLCLFGFVFTWWLLGSFEPQVMDSIPSPFTIEINGKPITKIDDGAEDRTQVTVGTEAAAAIFSLQNSRLQYGTWIVGRNLTENRSFGPKKVFWFKDNTENEKQVQPVTAKKEGDAYQLIFTKGSLMVEDGFVLVDLLGEAQSEVKIILQ